MANVFRLCIMCRAEMNNRKLILASKSTRRLNLLETIVPKDKIIVIESNAEEIFEPCESAESFCKRMAERKVNEVWKKFEGERDTIAAVIGADTVIWFDDRIIGQPANEADAVRTLTDLRGSVHEVVTGVAVFIVSVARMKTISVRSKVWMHEFDEKAIDDYVATGEPLDKAGAYGIQGQGRFLIARYEGSYSNIVGLPVEELRRILKDLI